MNLARNLAAFLVFASALSSFLPSHVVLAAGQHTEHGPTQSALVEAVRQATEPFVNAQNVPEGYGQALGCVSGPEDGAMGVHFVNSGLLGDAVIEPTQPEALIYEFKGSEGRLVGAEFIVFAERWHATHPPNDVPILEGQLLHFVESPNRFGLPAFYELHVWAWRNNPNGAFVDWNPRVSCEGR